MNVSPTYWYKMYARMFSYFYRSKILIKQIFLSSSEVRNECVCVLLQARGFSSKHFHFVSFRSSLPYVSPTYTPHDFIHSHTVV
jgi:hypothetical protein